MKYRWPAFAWLILFGFYSITAIHVADWPVFSSPDETANYSFARQFSQDSQLSISTVLASGAPRSVLNQNYTFKPASFVFFPAFLGTVGKISGTLGMLLFGPALAATAVICLWFICKKLFTSSAPAFWATAIFATAPTYWFYASRGFWQNGIFLSLLVIALWIGIQAAYRHWWPLNALCGLVAGIAIAVRPSEVVWFIPGVAVSIVFFWRRIIWKYFLIGIVASVFPLLSLISLQKTTYGDPLVAGYKPTGLLVVAEKLTEQNRLQEIKEVLFPFGTSLRTAWDRLITNGTKPISYIVIPGALGLFWLIFRRQTSSSARAILIGSVVGSIVLIVLYGNYRFIEYPISRDPTLGSSYLRYWLPLIPLYAIGIASLLHFMQQYSRIGKQLGWVLAGGFVILNISLILTTDIGLVKTLPRFSQWQDQSRWVAEKTDEQAIIIAGSNDKLVFPRRQTIGFNGTFPTSKQNLRQIAQSGPAYVLLPSNTNIESLSNGFLGVTILEEPQEANGLKLIRLQVAEVN